METLECLQEIKALSTLETFPISKFSLKSC